MNLINFNTHSNNISTIISSWADSKPVPDLIDSFTYDLYESNNPFNITFSKDEINNKSLRYAINTTTKVSAEVFSAFANPYYLTHKITRIPVYYQTVVDKYKND